MPSWSTLAATNTSESVVGRAALYTLARETTAHISAHELTETLRTRVSCSEATVRRLLRATPCPCFTEVRWQVGADQAGEPLKSAAPYQIAWTHNAACATPVADVVMTERRLTDDYRRLEGLRRAPACFVNFLAPFAVVTERGP